MKRKISVLLLSLVGITLFFIACQKDDAVAEVSGLLVKTTPTKINYYEGEELELSGLVVTIKWDNGKVEDVKFEDFTIMGIKCLPENGSKLLASTSVNITHSVTGTSVNQSITVSKLEVTGLLIKTPPTKLDYYKSDVLDLSGLIVTLTNNNGSLEEISFTEFESNGIECSPASGTIVTSELTEVIVKHDDSGVSANQDINYVTLTDIDGNIYPLVKVGNQIWMAEDLRVTKEHDGTAILLVDNEIGWSALNANDTDKAYNNGSDGNVYYTYAAAKDACPEGWHLSSRDDWNTLVSFIAADGYEYCEGKTLKTITGYREPDDIDDLGTDIYGFSGTPNGCRSRDYSLFGVGRFGFWWGSETSATEAWRCNLHFNNSRVEYYSYEKNLGFAVRCVKD